MPSTTNDFWVDATWSFNKDHNEKIVLILLLSGVVTTMLCISYIPWGVMPSIYIWGEAGGAAQVTGTVLER